MVHTATKRIGLALLFGASLQAQAQSPFTVFACEPEWAALTRVLLPTARLHVATHAKQDPHHIEARPALIAQLRASDAAICSGAALESGWLPVLQQRAGNAKVSNSAASMFFAADHVSLIDAQPGVIGTPWAGDVHEQGNPHFHTDPRRLLEVAQAWSDTLQQLQPAQAAAIAQRHAAFQTQWRQRITEWERRAAPIKGQRVAAQHSSFAYLLRWLGVQQGVDLEPKPGMAPTPVHLQRLLETLRTQPAAAVVISSYQDPRPGRWLSGQFGSSLPVLILPATVEDETAPDALGQWMDQVVNALVGTLAKSR